MTTPSEREALTERLQEIIERHLTSLYACTRVWEAWSVGTMTEDDFVPAGETEFARDLAGELAAALASAPAQAGVHEALRALLSLVRREAPHLSGKVLGDAEAAIAKATGSTKP